MAHATLTKLTERAKRNGSARSGETWAVESKFNLKGLEYYKYFHYGTCIAHIVDGELIGYYGESWSDANALNSILHMHGISGHRFTFRPVNGGFIHFRD